MKFLYLFISSICITIFGKAQTDVYNTGGLYMTNSSDTFFVTGSVTNTNTASLNNVGGNLYIKQHLTNNEASMVAGGGKLWFTGAATQYVYGSNPFRTKDWIVDNAAGVTLQNRLSVGNGSTGTLTFTNGQITSGTNTQDVFFYPNSTYMGYDDSKHIIGYCTKSGSTNFTFPIGNGTLKADLDIANLSTTSDFQCKYFGVGYGSYLMMPPIVSVYDKEYWILDRTAGTASSNITLKWNDARNAFNHSFPSQIRVGHFESGYWNNEGGIGSGNTATGSVTSHTVSTYSPFTFASIGAILPLQIQDFTTTINTSCMATVSWKSYSEENVQQYEIEKSNNGNSFNKVKTIVASIANNEAITHHYNNLFTSLGNNWFRIKVITKNGAHFYTPTQLVKNNCGSKQIKLFPTVTTGIINIETDKNITPNSIAIYNAVGAKMPMQQNGQPNTIDLSKYTAGNYTIVINNGDTMDTFKIIKKN